MKLSMYDEITNQIISQLEQINPLTDKWQKPWFNIGSAPMNAITKKSYRGINHVILGFKPYSSKFYASYKQWQERDCQVKQGEKGHRIVFWNFTEDEKTGDTYAFLRHYNVFNSEQVTGKFVDNLQDTLNAKLNEHEAIANAESFISSYLEAERIPVKDYDKAFYSPIADVIAMPKLGQFRDVHSYYSTFLHEAAHSTGHNSRLDRPLANPFGSKEYAKEELVAEISAAMLCGHLQLANKPRADHSQYIASWLTILKSDKRFVISAAGKAQKACDYIISKAEKPEIETQETLAA